MNRGWPCTWEEGRRTDECVDKAGWVLDGGGDTWTMDAGSRVRDEWMGKKVDRGMEAGGHLG